MNYTTNYHLPQWVKTDRIMMDDFNAAMSSLEEGLTEAKETADTAKTLGTAAYSPEMKPYAVGSYVGNESTLSINLGFRPSFVIISATDFTGGSSAAHCGKYVGITAGNKLRHNITFTDTGFTVTAPSTEGYPNLNAFQYYDYIAFR